MKKYKVKILFKDGTDTQLNCTEGEIRQFKNVNEYVWNITNKKSLIRKIEVKGDGNNRANLTFDDTFEQWMDNGVRVEAQNDPGFEDYTGYGNRTDGKVNRFYLGKSTGWIPIYLEILKSNSSGGGGLMHTNRKFKPLYHLNSRH